MGNSTTGGNRHFGRTSMARMGELRRQALVIASEVTQEIPLDSDYPRRVSVQRSQETAPGTPSAGLGPTWAPVAGLTDLVGHVRRYGFWNDKETGLRVALGDSERMVMLMDVPAGGDGLVDEVLLTDRLVFDDPVKGAATVWDVKAVRISKRDGIVVCKVQYAREDY